jgi:SAM-dependent methyltransferase
MDESTLAAYDSKAGQYCDEWLGQPPTDDIQALWRQFFLRGAPGADIGSGSGRDVDWLNRNGYPCVGFDPSTGLLDEARRRFPRWCYALARLPDLQGVAAGAYCNVVCETVLMHLPRAQVQPAACSLARIVAPGGTLYLSWRVTEGADVRDAAGRLYCAFPAADVRGALGAMARL